jgi:lantibiotic biosynthesis protein
MKNHSFLKTAILRTPLGAIQTQLTLETIQEIFAQTHNREALFLGSPAVYHALVSWEKGGVLRDDALQKLKTSLYKYASRLSNRCTPFGKFATVSTLKIEKETKIDIANSTLGRRTKYDMHFLGQLLPVLTTANAIREQLHYYPNSSLYTVFEKYRYVEYYFKDNTRMHKISEVEISDYLDLILEKSKKGILIHEIVSLLVSESVTEAEALEFINTLIASQFIVSELEFTLTGEDYFEKLVKTFSEKRFDCPDGQVVRTLINRLKNKINALDQNKSNDPALYLEIFQEINYQIETVTVEKLFQVDSFRKIANGTLGFNTLKTIRPAITAINKLQSIVENKRLKEFKTKFLARYEEYEQPLVQVLDPDVGIGYGKQSGAKTPLVEDLEIKGHEIPETPFSLDAKSKFLLRKLIQATKNNATQVVLTDAEINEFEENETLYPDTFSVFLNAFSENGDEKIHLKSISGASATSLIGRFSHHDTPILDLCNEIVAVENQLHPYKIIAEIVHLPQARTGNVLCRNFQREYEIPYLGNASVDQEHQIAIADLLVSVKNGKVVLRSKRWNKEIIPKLSNAHNYGHNSLPIYHFLCDIQNQESTGFGFSWGNLQSEFDFLPRLIYKEVILSKATWNLHKTDIDTILKSDESSVIATIRAFRTKRNLPDVVCLMDGDNEVLINFTNDWSCLVFQSMLKGKSFVQVAEFLFTENSITQNYGNEIIVSAHKNLEKKKETKTAPTVVEVPENTIESSFSIGDNWLYYKLYCGERAGEVVLNEAINPIVAELQSKNLIDKWFFIRYHDAIGSHLRFRILLKSTNFFTDCIQIVNAHTKPLQDAQIIWKIQTDTYLRELQRYGYEAIEDAETLFWNDSECTLQFLDLIEDDSGEKVRWLFSLLSIDHLLDDFGFSLEEKAEIMKVAKTSFGKEFHRNGNLNKQINTLFAENESEIEHFLHQEQSDEMYVPLWDIVRERSQNNKKPIENITALATQNQLPTALNDIAISYMHMVCNRLFLSKHRMHEMVVYDFLFKYYTKEKYKNRKIKPKLRS